MKPKRIRLSAFGPFGSEIDIPLEKLGQGLFLVTGDTGAGKTTLFDAICFALFGDVSGSMRTIDTIRSDFAQAEEKTFVEFHFFHKGKVYQIYRSPKYQKLKKNGKGLTQVAAEAILTREDKSVVTGYKAVTEEVQALLGIDVNQFKQIVMIAQGEFLKLLLADSGERGILLRKIFHTEKFLQMQNALKEKEKKCKAAYEENEKRILQYLGEVICDDDEKFPALAKEKRNDIYRVEETVPALNELLSCDKEKLKKIDSQLDMYGKELENTSQQLIEERYLFQAFQQWETVQEEVNRLQARKEAIEEKIQQVGIFEKAMYQVDPIYQQYEREAKEREALAHNKKVLMEKIEEKEALFLQSQKQWEQQKDKSEEKEGLLAEMQKENQQLELYQTQEKLEVEIKQLTVAIEKSLNQMETIKKDIQKGDVEREAAKKILNDFEGIEVTIATMENKWKEALDKKEKLENIKESFEQIQKDKKNYLLLKKQFQEMEEVYQGKKREYDDKEHLFLREQAGILAKELKEGEPCPVCGSTVHPQKAIFSSETLSKESLQEEKIELEKASDALYDLSAQCKSLYTELTTRFSETKKRAKVYIDDLEQWQKEEYVDKLSDILQGVDREELSIRQKLNQCKEDKRIKKETMDKWELLEASLSQLQKNKQEQEVQHTQMEIELRGKKASLEEIKKQLPNASLDEAKKIWQDRRNLYQKLKNDFEAAQKEAQERKSQWESQKAIYGELEDRQEKQIKTYEKVKNMLWDVLIKEGFSSLESFQQVIQLKESIESVKAEIKIFQEADKRNQLLLEQLSNEIKGKEKPNLIQTEQKKLEAQQRKKALEDEKKELSIRYLMNEKVWKNAAQLCKERKLLASEYQIIQGLSKTACGELNGKQKIMFEQYIQAFYFDRIIEEANKRLYQMTTGRYELLRQESAENLRSQSGLGLEIMDYYTGKKRSVKSLSGGEAFKASLSLALGLSDVIQHYAGGVEIDTMFIDEGFGTLDEESLEQAISTLHELTYGERLVGIISHVTELKSRIEKQIIVKKGTKGSIAEIIA